MTADPLQYTIRTRRSIRRFSSDGISEGEARTLLEAAMSAPSSEDSRRWRFLVIRARDLLDALPGLHPSAGPAREAPLAILVCADVSLPASLFWPQDCAAAVENILLSARGMGIGSLWCGIHPVEHREEAFSSFFGLPGTVRPFALVILGRTGQEFLEEKRFDPALVHLDRWEYPYPV